MTLRNRSDSVLPDGERVSPRERAVDVAAPIIERMESRYPERIIAAAVVNAILPILKGEMLNEWGHAKDRPSVNRMAARLVVVALDALAAPARLDPRQDDSVIPSSTGLVAVADQRARPGRGCFEQGRADCDDCYCDALAPVAAPSPVPERADARAAEIVELREAAQRLWDANYAVIKPEPGTGSEVQARIELEEAWRGLRTALAAPSPVEADEGAA